MVHNDEDVLSYHYIGWDILNLRHFAVPNAIRTRANGFTV